MTTAERIKATIRDVENFPKQGITFKDITPILKDYDLCDTIIYELWDKLRYKGIDAIAGIESRGFLFGLPLAIKLGVPFIPIRKAGKLPFHTVQKKYDLEYGSAIIEIHKDAFELGAHIHIHDDLLATGGTSVAAGELIEEMDGIVAGYSFIVSIPLNGREVISKITDDVIVLSEY